MIIQIELQNDTQKVVSFISLTQLVSRNIADSLKTVLFIGFLYACVMIYHSGYHLYTVSNI